MDAAIEKAKYEQIWANMDYRSGKSKAFANIINKHCSGRILDFGCGNCETATHLRCGIAYHGLDITTEQVMGCFNVYEMPAWECDVLGVGFEYTVSNDFLEHLPEHRVAETIEKMCAITKRKTIHAISTREAISSYLGHKVHLTVKPLDWWSKQFSKHTDNFILFDADDI